MERGMIEGCLVCGRSYEKLKRGKVPLLARNGVGVCQSCLLLLAIDCSRGTGMPVLFRNGDKITFIENGALCSFDLQDMASCGDKMRCKIELLVFTPTLRDISDEEREESDLRIEESRLGSDALMADRRKKERLRELLAQMPEEMLATPGPQLLLTSLFDRIPGSKDEG